MARRLRRKTATNPLPEYPLLMIEWVDSTRLSDGWTPLGQIEGPSPHQCVTVGFLIKESDSAKVLAPSFGDIASGDNRQAYGGSNDPDAGDSAKTRLR